MQLKKNLAVGLACLAVASLLAAGVYFVRSGSADDGRAVGHAPGSPPAPAAAAASASSVVLTEGQLKAITVAPVAERRFADDREAVGTIDFNQNMTVQVSPPWAGRVVELLVKEGDDVQKGQALFVMDSPDLVQAESTLISTAGVRALASHALERARQLYAVQGMALKDLEQATSDQQAAEGAYQAARDAVRIFGKSDAEMDRLVAERRVEGRLTVRSTVQGRVTARNAAPGTLVQPGGTPAPYTVSDLSTKWMLASVAETDVPLLRLGQAVDVTLSAYPGRVFRGKVSRIGAALDPNTHRATVESEVRDPHNELHPQMLATFTLHTSGETRSPAVPEASVVREGDGTTTVWVTTDRRHFSQRQVKSGLRRDGYVQIVDGLKPGELTAVEGAVFLSNMLAGADAPD